MNIEMKRSGNLQCIYKRSTTFRIMKKIKSSLIIKKGRAKEKRNFYTDYKPIYLCVFYLS